MTDIRSRCRRGQQTGQCPHCAFTPAVSTPCPAWWVPRAPAVAAALVPDSETHPGRPAKPPARCLTLCTAPAAPGPLGPLGPLVGRALRPHHPDTHRSGRLPGRLDNQSSPDRTSRGTRAPVGGAVREGWSREDTGAQEGGTEAALGAQGFGVRLKLGAAGGGGDLHGGKIQDTEWNTGPGQVCLGAAAVVPSAVLEGDTVPVQERRRGPGSGWR